GWLESPSIVLNTRFGRKELTPSQISEIHFGRREGRERPRLQLQSGEQLEWSPSGDAKASLDTGFGSMSIPLDEIPDPSFDRARKEWRLTTAKLTATGKV